MNRADKLAEIYGTLPSIMTTGKHRGSDLKSPMSRTQLVESGRIPVHLQDRSTEQTTHVDSEALLHNNLHCVTEDAGARGAFMNATPTAIQRLLEVDVSQRRLRQSQN